MPNDKVILHPLIVRLTHWTWALGVVLLIMSGLRIFNQEPVLSTALDTRMRAIADEVGFPIRLTVEEAEEVIRILWEFVGHMGADVGEHGYDHA